MDTSPAWDLPLSFLYTDDCELTTAGMVYKLVSRTNDAGEFIAVPQSPENKINVGGRKHAVRRLDETMAELPAVVNRLQRGEPAIPAIYA